MSKILPFIFNKFGYLWENKWEHSKKHPIVYQDKLFRKLITEGKYSQFGREHKFEKIDSYETFKALVPVREYEDFIPYINSILKGDANVLYPGRPVYLAKTSGTTADIKLIPVYPEILKASSFSAINMMISYARSVDNFDIFRGKTMIIQGSPALEDMNGLLAGKMSGISYHAIPAIFKSYIIPSYEVNAIEDIHLKIDGMVAETIKSDLRVIAGLPPWAMLYIERVLEITGKKTILDVFPNLQLYAHGGVNFDPYRRRFFKKIGREINTLDCYTASEGHFGFQEDPNLNEITLCCDNKIFYEFIEFEHLRGDSNNYRISLKDVEVNKNYAVLLSSLSGLWSYQIGDVIKFTNTNPYRFVFVGRVSQFTSLFTEHVIESEVRNAIKIASEKLDLSIRYFTVAPMVPAESEKPYQEWWIEFEEVPQNITLIEDILNDFMCRQNYSYDDLYHSNVISKLKIKIVPYQGFEKCMSSLKKLDVQSKVPILSNNRSFVNRLESFISKLII